MEYRTSEIMTNFLRQLISESFPSLNNSIRHLTKLMLTQKRIFHSGFPKSEIEFLIMKFMIYEKEVINRKKSMYWKV